MKLSSLKILSTSLALLTGLSVIGMGRSALAQDAEATFTFTSTIDSECQFNNAGIGNNISTTATLARTGDILSGNNSTVDVNCNFDGGELQITEVSEDAGNAVIINTDANLTATATLTNNATPITLTADRGGTSATSTLDAGTTNIDLALEADFGAGSQAVVAGTYVYNVVMTLTNN